MARLLPQWAYNSVKTAIYGWEFQYKYEPFARVGPSFILVTPGKNELWVADPGVANAIMTRRNDFVQFDIANRELAVEAISPY